MDAAAKWVPATIAAFLGRQQRLLLCDQNDQQAHIAMTSEQREHVATALGQFACDLNSTEQEKGIRPRKA